jgi:hypothetical protein
MPTPTQLQVPASDVRSGDVLRLIDKGNDEGLVTDAVTGSKFRSITVKGRGTPLRYQPAEEVCIIRQVETPEEREALKMDLALRDLMALVARAVETKASVLAAVEADPIYAVTWNADGLVIATELGRLAVQVFDICDARPEVSLRQAIEWVKEDCTKRIFAAATGGSRSSSTATNLVEDCQVKAWAYFVERLLSW